MTRPAAARKKAARQRARERNGINGASVIHVLATNPRPRMHEALATLIRVSAGTTCSAFKAILDKRNLVEYAGWALQRGLALGLIELRK